MPPLLTDFLDYMDTIRGASAGTRKEYGYDLTQMLRFLYGRRNNTPVEDVTDEMLMTLDESFHQTIQLRDLYAFLSYLDRDKQNKAASRTRKISAMASYFKFLHEKIRVITTNPTDGLERPKKQSRYPVYLTLEESKHLLAVVQSQENPMYRTRDYAMVLLFLTCGLRLSELAQIDITDIKGDTLRVVGKGNKERVIYLSPAVLEAFQDLKQHRPVVDDEEAMFLSTHKKRMTNRAIQYRIDKHLRDAGFDTTVYSTHKLRHTAATLMYKHGQVDIRTLQKLLGHVSVATTQIYTHTDEEQLRVAVSKNPISEL